MVVAVFSGAAAVARGAAALKLVLAR